MKAMVIRNFGGPEVFEKAEVDTPEVKPGFVLVKVAAGSINPLETRLRAGLAPAFTPPFPAILNSDFSGEIVAVGSGVEDWQVGDEVIGGAGGIGAQQGALAEYILVDANFLAPKPKNISHAKAALFPLVSITAWEALRENAFIGPDDKLLIYGAAGGVGLMAVQLAKLMGADVYGAVRSPRQAETAVSFGADQTILVDEEKVEEFVAKHTQGKGFEAVFDTIGGNNLVNSLAAAKLKGRVCTTNARTTLDLTPMYQKALTLKAVLYVAPIFYNAPGERVRQGNILKNISQFIAEGKLDILQDERQFGFDEIQKAHEYVESNKNFGKISLINNL
ncbi:MAG: zinc-binding dehydrogenase [Clostridia bacterium]|nr:zinc-binding dehydrogenase [Clostridia bacterium]